ncbi:MAG: DUF6531 domain-containing protein [Arenicella sp.]
MYKVIQVFSIIALSVVSLHSIAQSQGKFSVRGLPGTFATLSDAEQALKAISIAHSHLEKVSSEQKSDTITEHYYAAEGVEPEVSEEKFKVQRTAFSDHYFDTESEAVNVRGAEIYGHPACPANQYTPRFDWPTCNSGNGTYPVRRHKELTPSGELKSITEGNKRSYKVDYNFQPRNETRCYSASDGMSVFRDNTQTCPDGFIGQLTSCSFTCVNPTEGTIVEQTDSKEDCPGGENTAGNPCHIATGAKYANEIDFSSGKLQFQRNYHSQNLVDKGFGVGWHNRYIKHLSVSDSNLSIVEGSGRSEPWRNLNGLWQGDIDTHYFVTQTSNGYTLTLKRGDVHEYALDGRLLSETDTQGKTTAYEYDAQGRLISVNHHYQHSLTFEYSNDGKNHVVKVIDAMGIEYGYEYDTNDNLTAVIYPDENSDPNDNPRKIYHYENLDFPNHLTGITDTKGNRYATYAYDANGKAITTEHAQTTNTVGQERYQLNFGTQGAN